MTSDRLARYPVDDGVCGEMGVGMERWGGGEGGKGLACFSMLVFLFVFGSVLFLAVGLVFGCVVDLVCSVRVKGESRGRGVSHPPPPASGSAPNCPRALPPTCHVCPKHIHCARYIISLVPTGVAHRLASPRIELPGRKVPLPIPTPSPLSMQARPEIQNPVPSGRPSGLGRVGFGQTHTAEPTTHGRRPCGGMPR